ncbi:MAG TPA: ATP-binding protein, partial [Candidatus Caenarcaniphilales bacterium]|nr:ATP-binding protein [Candidatus Caenarcaniphilales bacterium]
MASTSVDPSHLAATGGGEHAILVCDARGKVVAGSGLGYILGQPDLDHHGELAALVIPDEPGRRLPQPGENAALAVRGLRDDERLILSSHPLRLPDTAGAEGPLTIFVLARAPASHDPAIDRGIAAVLSHELRTPITTIYAGSQMLLRRSRLSEESQREMLADIEVEADRLYRLVEDLLVANVGTGGIEVVDEPILLQRTLPRVVAIEAGRWPQVNFVTTLASELPAVRADELYLEHIIRDLLANAGSFTVPHGSVRVDARRARDRVEVRVLDDGPGIDDEQARSLFRPFRGAQPDGGGRPGPGLGLYVCKLLVEAMGGGIWARPRPSGGSEFGFSLLPYREDPDDEGLGSGPSSG